MKVLVVVDMQNDFIDQALGTKEAVGIVDNVAAKIKNFDGKVIFTRDTHHTDYMSTQEGHNLPVEHCIKDSEGWQISSALPVSEDALIIDKPTFGSKELGLCLEKMAKENDIEEIEVIGLCTDICVISNALLIKAFLPEVKITVDASCCAGVTPQSHQTALDAMKACQINIIGA
ncbi:MULTISPECIES: cysteine hydrolase family protein [unclassified Butyrivibrio]|uniref:cysteine hydrolase family protein n=1 Tax=unclassified Butyrivibrio TaxID=2639466 RepID=UPI000412FFDC|nr:MULTISPECIES: isochorismatase family cysteine hydrolase [unclassified Butyrivibrio]